MDHKMIRFFRLGIVFMGIFSAISMAIAGSEQDAEQAEKEFARGDLVKAEELWRKAAKQGYASAQVRLGYFLDKSEQDQEAVEWYRKAAEQGNAEGEYNLGVMYAAGEGVKKDLGQARIWIQRAAEKDFVNAVSAMAQAYKNGDLGLAVDMDKSLIWQSKLKSILESTTPAAAQDKKENKGTAKEGK